MRIKGILDVSVGIFAGIIVAVILTQFFLVWDVKCEIGDISTAPNCIKELVMVIIPTEVTAEQGLYSFPYLIIIILLLYWLFFSPYLDEKKKDKKDKGVLAEYVKKPLMEAERRMSFAKFKN